MTFMERFEVLKQQLQKTAPHQFAEDFAIQVCMTDEDCGGIFYIAYIDGVFAVEPYDYYDHTAALTAASDVFEGFINGKRVAAAQLGIEGNEQHVKLLQGLAKEKKEKKPAVRKTAKKPVAKAKTEAKPAAGTVKKQEKKAAEKQPPAKGK